MSETTGRPKTFEEVRGRIDRGETGDKVAAEDPAAAPLGTDAEAGGVPTPAADVGRSFEAEAVAAEGGRASPGRRAGSRGPWIVLLAGIGLAILVAIGVVLL